MTYTVEETVQKLRELGMSTTCETLRLGIQQGKFPFADCVQRQKQTVYYVYPKLLDKWINERF